MDLGIKGRTALVTGGSRGLGLQCALSLARESVNVAICGRTQATLDGHGHRDRGLRCQVDRCCGRYLRRLGR